MTFDIDDPICHQTVVAILTAAIHEPSFLTPLITSLDEDDARTVVRHLAIGARVLLKKISTLSGKPLPVILTEMGLYAAATQDRGTP